MRQKKKARVGDKMGARLYSDSATLAPFQLTVSTSQHFIGVLVVCLSAPLGQQARLAALTIADTYMPRADELGVFKEGGRDGLQAWVVRATRCIAFRDDKLTSLGLIETLRISIPRYRLLPGCVDGRIREQVVRRLKH